MTLSGPFILRPIATSLLMLALFLSGLLAYRLLPVSALPEVDYPTIQVATFYPGASPDVVATAITAPLEKQFGQMSGLTQMSSSSASGASMITLQFSLSTSLDVAEQEVQAAINAAGTFLPQELPNPPIYNKVNPADTPIITLALTSNTLSLPQVEDYADTRLAQKISQLPGVGLVSMSGGQKPAVRIQANPNVLAAYGLTFEDIRNAVVTGNVNLPKGSFDGPQQAFTINANDQLLTSAAYRPLIIAYKNNSPIRLQDVAEVIDAVENVKQAAWVNTTPAVIMNVQRQPGANIIETVDRIKQLLPQLRANMPAEIKVSILSDRTLAVRASIADAQYELLFAVALVVLVIFVFLRNLPATFIPSMAVPLSLIGSLGVMYLLGYSLNNLTLMALIIATGFVVDDAIVMIENIARYIEHGETPLTAALKGAKQIGFTIVSLTISLIAVLIPLLFMQDMLGRLFREFAITLSITILLSAFISLSLTPMLCARMLRQHQPNEVSRFDHWSETSVKWMIDRYGKSLAYVLQHQSATLLVALITLIVTVWLFYVIPKGFFPTQDVGIIQGVSEAAQSISFPAMAERQQALARVILQDPAVESLSSFIGIDGTNTTLNNGRMQINLKPLNERDVRATKVIKRLQAKLANVVGITLYMQPVQDITVDNRVSRTQYQYSLSSPDANLLAHWTKLLIDKLRTIPILKDVTSDQQNGGLYTQFKIDRDTAARLGITALTIDNIFYDAFGQRQISTMFTQLNQYRVVLEALPAFKQDPQSLNNIYINSVTGGAVPLSAITHMQQLTGPLVINRQGQFPVSLISFNLASRASLGEAVAAIEQAKNTIGMPASIQTSFEGAAKVFQSALTNEIFLVIAAILVVYIVLGVLYESYIHPITILSTLPSATLGALLALMLFNRPLTVIALIGIILLIGIVKKNAIMMIDFALDLERNAGKNPGEAIYAAALLRFRPILMTTLAALFGAVPLAFGSGMGSELRQPLGITIIGGLILSQLLTLYTTPVIYLAFDKASRILVRRGWFESNNSLDEA